MQDVITILQLFPYLLLAWANRAKKTKGEIERREGRVGGGGRRRGRAPPPCPLPHLLSDRSARQFIFARFPTAEPVDRLTYYSLLTFVLRIIWTNVW